MQIQAAFNPYTVRISPKAESRIMGFIGIWGTPAEADCYGTWFNKRNPPKLGLDFLPFMLWYEHGEDPAIGREPIGKITKVWYDDIGIRFEAELDTRSPHYHRIRQEIRRGLLKTSSSTAGHGAYINQDGSFGDWYIFEHTLTKTPCEHRMPVVDFVRNQFGKTSLLITRGHRIPTMVGVSPTPETRCHCQTCKTSKRDGVTMPTMQQIGIPDDTDPMALLSALVEDFGYEAIMQALQSAGQGGQPTAMAAPDTAEARGLAEMGLDANLDPAQILAAMVEAYGFEQIMQALQALAPVPEGAMETSSAPAADAPATPISEARAAGMVAALLNDPARLDQLITTRVNALVAEKVQKLMTTPPNNNQAPATRAVLTRRDRENNGVSTQVVDYRYDHLEPREMALGYELWRNAHRAGAAGVAQPPTESYMRAMALKVMKELDVRESQTPTLRNAHAARHHREFVSTTRRAMPFKRANELMGSTVASAGDEWVGVYYSNDLWEQVRQDANLYSLLLGKGMVEREVPQGAESVVLPLEGADPTFYTVGQTVSEDATGQAQTLLSSSKPGTGKATITVSKLGAAIVFTGELEEDSLIPVLPELRRKLDMATQEELEYVMINGDTVTTASTNINLIDGTPTATALGSYPDYLLMNGFLKLALLGAGGANARAAGAVFNEDDFLETLKLMGTNGKNALNKGRVLFILDDQTYFRALALAILKTQDKFNAATIQDGDVTKIWGRDLYAAERMPLANSSGLVSATPGNNLYGRLLAVRADQWAVGWKRRVTTEISRTPRSDSTELVTWLRLGMINRDTEAATVTYGVAAADS